MFLIDTDVISELRKRERANRAVVRFFARFTPESDRCFLSVITVGELRRGVERLRHRGDAEQALRLESWLLVLGEGFAERILPIDREVAELWGRLRVPDPANSTDKLIAATALINGLTVVTRNVRHYRATGVPLLNPFG